MFRSGLRLAACALAVAAAPMLRPQGVAAQTSPSMIPSPSVIHGAVDDSQLVVLHGNTRPELRTATDLGRVPDNTIFPRMQLLLRRAPVTEAALDHYMDEQTRPGSPLYHHWLNEAQLAQKFGPAPADVAVLTRWLSAHGFQVDGVHSAGMIVDFTGSAAQLRSGFHTEMHALNVGGVAHIANNTDPAIPAALSGLVRGIVSLNDFRPHTNFKSRPNYTFTSDGSTYQAVVPADLATIYDLNPLFKAGFAGQGETVVLIEDTNVYSTADFTTFRTAFKLNTYGTATLTQEHPTGAGGACGNPGVVSGDEGEAELDVEWASAAAPAAGIVLASCRDTATEFGGLIALQNLIAAANPPPVVSISYGECEAENGATANAAYNTVYQQAAAAGVSVFVSSGDEGAASCDANEAKSTHGIAVSGFASTPYNVAVGGTDFGDTAAGTTSKYWKATNSGNYGSAISYIPEIPWNDSCASTLLATAAGYSTTYGAAGYCNSATGKADYLTTASGSGGPSGCATGSPSTSGVVSGSCAGYAKPSWQKLVGNPDDGVRDIPDVSLFAANGVWGHYYVYCDSDVFDGGAKCSGAPSGWSGAGGTSFASPIMAGIQVLIDQKLGSSQGNPNPTYYALATTEYGTKGRAGCDSNVGPTGNTLCYFHDVTTGDMDVNCTGTHNCYLPSGTNGVLSTDPSSYLPAYGTGTGWDFATGIGSVNATKLANAWPK